MTPFELPDIYVEPHLWHKQDYNGKPLPTFPTPPGFEPLQYRKNKRYIDISTFAIQGIQAKPVFRRDVTNVFYMAIGMTVTNCSGSAISVDMRLPETKESNTPIFLSRELYYYPVRRELNDILFLNPGESCRFHIISNPDIKSEEETSFTLVVKSLYHMSKEVEIIRTHFVGTHDIETITRIFKEKKGTYLEGTYINACFRPTPPQDTLPPIYNPTDLVSIFRANNPTAELELIDLCTPE